jgi:hypothetical protein
VGTTLQVKENQMKRRTDSLRAASKAGIVLLGLAIALSACAPGMTQQQIQALVEDSVAQTVQAQNSMATAVAQTVEARAPAASATALPTLAQVTLPTLTPIAGITPIVIPSGGGSGGGGGGSATVPDYACSFAEVKPLYNVFKPGDYIDFVWLITNTGKKDWPSALDLDFVSGTHFSPYVGEELPALESGERVTISFEGNAPDEPGFYHMNFKVQGGLCFPFTDIEVIKPPGQG